MDSVIKWVLPFLLGFTLMIAFQGTVRSQHPPSHQDLHDKFYQTWMIPNPGSPSHRQHSCCNKLDCYPAKVKVEDGRWFFMHRETQRWVWIPPSKLEHRQDDPRESPDGQSHICASITGHVYCAVLGVQY